MSAKLSDFLTPFPPCPHLDLIYTIEFTQPLLLRPLLHDPPPMPTSYLEAPFPIQSDFTMCVSSSSSRSRIIPGSGSSFYCDPELSDKGDSQTTTRGTESVGPTGGGDVLMERRWSDGDESVKFHSPNASSRLPARLTDRPLTQRYHEEIKK